MAARSGTQSAQMACRQDPHGYRTPGSWHTTQTSSFSIEVDGSAAAAPAWAYVDANKDAHAESIAFAGVAGGVDGSRLARFVGDSSSSRRVERRDGVWQRRPSECTAGTARSDDVFLDRAI